jgi:uncharacterized membrane protein YeaQ/YmgE (transglycosylase-associated protein family)
MPIVPGTSFLYPLRGNTCHIEVLGYIILLVLTGLVVGALGRLLLPGRDPMSLLETIVVGVAASLAAGLIAYYVFDSEEGGGLLLSVICAVAIVYAVRKFRQRRVA